MAVSLSQPQCVWSCLYDTITVFKDIFPTGNLADFYTFWLGENSVIIAWWRHQNEIFSGLLALCAGNSPVTGEFPAQRPVTRSFDIFFDPRLNKQLSKQSWGWWFETLWRSSWRHRNEYSIRPLVQIMAWHPFGTKPLSPPTLVHCQLDPEKHISMKFWLKIKIFHLRICIWKCRLQHGGHFESPRRVITNKTTQIKTKPYPYLCAILHIAMASRYLN